MQPITYRKPLICNLGVTANFQHYSILFEISIFNSCKNSCFMYEFVLEKITA